MEKSRSSACAAAALITLATGGDLNRLPESLLVRQLVRKRSPFEPSTAGEEPNHHHAQKQFAKERFHE